MHKDSYNAPRNPKCTTLSLKCTRENEKCTTLYFMMHRGFLILSKSVYLANVRRTQLHSVSAVCVSAAKTAYPLSPSSFPKRRSHGDLRFGICRQFLQCNDQATQKQSGYRSGCFCIVIVVSSGNSQNLVFIGCNVPHDTFNRTAQNSAKIINCCRIKRFVLPQLINRRTGDVMLVNQCIR